MEECKDIGMDITKEHLIREKLFDKALDELERLHGKPIKEIVIRNMKLIIKR